MYDRIVEMFKNGFPTIDISFLSILPAAAMFKVEQDALKMETLAVDRAEKMNEKMDEKEDLNIEAQHLENEKLKKELEAMDSSAPPKEESASIEENDSTVHASAPPKEKEADNEESTPPEEKEADNEESAPPEEKEAPPEEKEADNENETSEKDKAKVGGGDQTGGILFTKEECSFF